MVTVALTQGTIPFEFWGNSAPVSDAAACRPGHGLIAGGAVRAVLEAVGCRIF